MKREIKGLRKQNEIPYINTEIVIKWKQKENEISRTEKVL